MKSAWRYRSRLWDKCQRLNVADQKGKETDLEVRNLLLFGRESFGELGLALGGTGVFVLPLILLLRRFRVLGVEPPGADGQELCTWGVGDSSSSQVPNRQRTRARTNQVSCCVHDRGSTARQRFEEGMQGGMRMESASGTRSHVMSVGGKRASTRLSKNLSLEISCWYYLASMTRSLL